MLPVFLRLSCIALFVGGIVILSVGRADAQTVLTPSDVGTGFEGAPTASGDLYDDYGFTEADVVGWMAENAEARGIPSALPVTVSLHESELRNIPQYGCEDPSTRFQGCAYGYFQQTPPRWGTVEQVMDPVYALDAFLDAAEQYIGQYGDDCYSLAAWGQAVQQASIIRDMTGYCKQAKAMLGEGSAYQDGGTGSVAYDQYASAMPETVAYGQYAYDDHLGSAANQYAGHSEYGYDTGAAGYSEYGYTDVAAADTAGYEETVSPPVDEGGGGGGIYVVLPGETLSGIAAGLGTSVEHLAAHNGLTDPDYIRSGQVLYY